MKALKAIGIRKAIGFVFWQLYAVVLRICLLPQLRVILLRLAGATVGRDTIVYNVSFDNLYHYGFSKLQIGNRCFIGEETMIDLRGGVTLEDDVTISNRVSIVTHINVGYPDHPLQKLYPTSEKPVRVGRGSYVGTAATILPGVHVGLYSVVAAGAVVTKDVPDGTVVGGVPAKVLKRLHIKEKS